MEIDVLGTGSSGNCYKVKIGATTLLIECGLPYKRIQKKLNFKVSEIDACLITHEHQDHAKAIKDLMRAGIDCYMTKGTAEALEISGHRLNIFNTWAERKYKTAHLDDILIQPFEAVHDVAEPVSYFISTRDDKEVLVFVTDTAYMKYKIPACDVLMIECNYVKSVLDEQVENGKINISLRNRIVRNHLSLESLVEALKAADLSRCKKIYVLHLSDGNSNEEVIKRTIQELTGVEVVIC